MKIEQIKEIAKKRGVKTGKMKKGEIIRAIQEAEGNPACFDTGKADECGEMSCLWREDCK
ncbi:MAG: Rho termination factor N-terminal domain-containing protein [Geobacteraceae bacterium]|nr:Rho termination factor N-terminal domain-containing protein [Geobacteraceae bacterium]